MDSSKDVRRFNFEVRAAARNFAVHQREGKNSYPNKMYSKLRSSIGGLYHWRANASRWPEEKTRMMKEADFAFRQAFGLCPYSPEAIFRYVNLLVSANRLEDAITIGGTAQSLEPDNSQLRNLVSELNRKKTKEN